ncbi:ABC transporter ATP-binding protein [Microbacterium sp. YY-01]|uniref:ABC transporter ATP-binding protein n=1 Tax=Microbacterium sp. YY-01 TaxID=3421634 RepID=UPI003D178FA9
MSIEVSNLTKRYGSTYAVKDASFQVQPGQVTGFLGPNGAGKSTTMRAIVGLDHPTSGSATIGGRTYAKLRAPLREVGALLDAKSAHKSRTARNHLRTVAATCGISRRRVDEVLDLAGLTSVANKRLGGFSLGMGQRLGLAVALLGDPHTLILDEPVNGLDPDGVTWIRNLLRELADEGRTVFLSSHLLGEMSLIADHIVVIGKGEILADAPVSEFVQAGDLVRVKTPDAGRLAQVLAAPNVTTKYDGSGYLDVEGLTAEQIATTAAGAGLVLFEVTPIQRSLEDAYRDLTRESVQYQSEHTSALPTDASDPREQR